MQPTKSIPQSFWDKNLPLADSDVQFVIDEFKKATWKESTKYRDLVTLRSGTLPDCNFRVVQGELIVKGPIEKAVQYDQMCLFVTSDMTKDEREGKLFRFYYYPNDQVKNYVEAQRKSPQPFLANTTILHQVNESGVPLVSNREFVALRTAKDISENGKKKYIIATKSVDAPVDACPKAQRAVLSNFLQLEEIDNGQVKLQAYFHVDPCGSIPAMLFNSKMDAQCDALVNIHNHMLK